MKYLLLIYSDETRWPTLPQAELEKLMAEYAQFTMEIKRSGHLLDNARLERTATASTIRIRDGKMSTTDGPFAETKEQLGGFYLIEARDLNEAIQIGARIPGARFGSIEVRPVMPLPPNFPQG